MTDSLFSCAHTLENTLLEKVRELHGEEWIEPVARAIAFARKAHEGQMRASGDPYYLHPVEVAIILADLRLDVASIQTGLLHDTVEDTPVTPEDLREAFGEEVMQLVGGVTKLTQIEFKSEQAKQAENFRKLFLALSEDIRVLLVKLADRLHNLRTLEHIRKPEKRARIAHETMEIFVPLAERIGMRHVKEEMQDISFRELQPDARESILNRLTYLREHGQGMVDGILQDITRVMRDAGVECSISGREKKPYSIFKKMERKNISFEQLADIIAFRIIVADVPDCYRALGAIHHAYHTVPGYFKDYISTPKANAYRSLHTAVMGPGNQRIEVQIRTRAMHEIAEYGVAAHWAYKQEEKISTDGRQFHWIRQLLEILDTAEGAEEFLEHTKLEMYHDHVFCFTPRGDLIVLPRGGTPVDFAYAVHSEIGNTCVGAKVNGRIVPLKTPLRNGDQVEIIRSKGQTPSPGWERFVVTGKARSEVRRFIRTQQRTEYVHLGRSILEKTFRKEGQEFDDKLIEPHIGAFNKKSLEDLYAEVGEGLIGRMQVFDKAFPKSAAKKSGLVSRAFSFTGWGRRKQNDGSHAISIKGLIPGMAVHFAKCCHPLPGDQITGIVTTGKGVTIHALGCETLENFTDAPERWLEVSWNTDPDDMPHYTGRLKVVLSHESGALGSLAHAISQSNGNISNLRILSRNTDFFEILVDIEVQDLRHLNHIIADLRAKLPVQSVERHKI